MWLMAALIVATSVPAFAHTEAAAGGRDLREDRKGPLFRTIARGTKRLSGTPLPQANAFQLVQRRAVVADIATAIKALGSPPT